ncbi:MAG: hypothetical protein OXU27_13645 [Candidatus Poribacteria bacterium]|nr:hypothetical protein [Candidatus Poribacteria bacterium]
MFRDILSGSRAIFIGVVFFVLVVGGSLLYSWHVHRTTDAELAETRRKVQPLKNDKEARTTANTGDTSAVDFEHAGTDFETDDSQIPDNTGASPIDQTSEMLDMADAFLPDDFVSEEAPAEDVPVSPHGFGPYPEVPTGYPKEMTPTWVKYENPSRDHELMHRVLIKLWNQGDHNVSGAFMENGLVYPLYPNTAYVTYDYAEMPDGTLRRFIRSASGSGATLTIPPEGGPAVLPEDVIALDKDNAGISPYEFLDLR